VDTRDGVEGIIDGGRVRGEEVRGLEGILGELERRRGGDTGAGASEGEAMDTS
jgi:kinetochore protein Mis12/MTW1